MTSSFGEKIKIEIVGGSHTDCICGSISGLPKGIKIDENYIALQMSRRAPGNGPTATARKEADKVEFVSGVENFVTTGEKIEIKIQNTNTKSSDYDNLKFTPRPSHADYPAFVKYGGEADMRGSGHFSGRMTAVMVALGSICRLYLKEKGITVGGHVYNIGDSFDTVFDGIAVDAALLDELSEKYFATVSPSCREDMEREILAAKKENDSIGGSVQIAVTGMPVGIGNHIFGGVENVISSYLFGVPAVKGVSFGAGFEFSFLRGSEANDPYYFDGDTVKTETNNCGGICGGMTTGMPIIVNAVFKPTPSIAAEQKTVNLKTKENTVITVGGRHDPCIVPRGLPAAEAAVALAITELLARDEK
ncbi:MAG: chorismate synthase [Clostridiales bacterium]|nr:chorismate synthase [Candidatus Equinaster intestinalis]